MSSRKVAWGCPDDHLTGAQAVLCAQAERERRSQGAREVIDLLRCEPCDRWWAPGQAGPSGCPVCGVGLEAVRLVVLERGPVS